MNKEVAKKIKKIARPLDAFAKIFILISSPNEEQVAAASRLNERGAQPCSLSDSRTTHPKTFAPCALRLAPKFSPFRHFFLLGMIFQQSTRPSCCRGSEASLDEEAAVRRRIIDNLTDCETLNNGIGIGGVEDFRRKDRSRRIECQPRGMQNRRLESTPMIPSIPIIGRGHYG